jgi:TolB-like protein
MVRLTDADTGFHTWSKLYAVVSQDLFATQEKVSKSIAGALSVITQASLEPKRPSR